MDGTAPLKTPEKKPRQKRWLRIGLIIAGLCGLVAFAWAMTQLPHYLELQQMMRDPMVQKNLLGMTLEEGYERMRVPEIISFAMTEPHAYVVRRYHISEQQDTKDLVERLRKEAIRHHWQIEEGSNEQSFSAQKQIGNDTARLYVSVDDQDHPQTIIINIRKS